MYLVKHPTRHANGFTAALGEAEFFKGIGYIVIHIDTQRYL